MSEWWVGVCVLGGGEGGRREGREGGEEGGRGGAREGEEDFMSERFPCVYM